MWKIEPTLHFLFVRVSIDYFLLLLVIQFSIDYFKFLFFQVFIDYFLLLVIQVSIDYLKFLLFQVSIDYFLLVLVIHLCCLWVSFHWLFSSACHSRDRQGGLADFKLPLRKECFAAAWISTEQSVSVSDENFHKFYSMNPNWTISFSFRFWFSSAVSRKLNQAMTTHLKIWLK